MTARVPIIHVADTAFTIGQGAREGQPRHDHWPPNGCLRGLDYEPSTSQLQELVERAGLQVVIAMPSPVAVGPVQAPVMGVGVVAQLSDAHLGPFGQVRMPRRSAFVDADRAAADRSFNPDLVQRLGLGGTSQRLMGPCVDSSVRPAVPAVRRFPGGGPAMALSKDPLRPVTWTLPGAVPRVSCNSNSVESATQKLHRLTWVERYDEARGLEPPVDDPAVVQGFTPMDRTGCRGFTRGITTGRRG